MSSMALADLAGWLAAAMTFGTFASRDMARLRALAVLANLAFIAYGAGAGLWPLLALHLALLPVNLRRLLEHRQSHAPAQFQPPRSTAKTPSASQPAHAAR